jgi:hypothetical protein
MLADIIVKVAGFEKEESSKYYPRPSLAGPERCIRQMVYWGSNTPKDKEISDRLMMTIDDSVWHEELTADWLRKSAYQFSSEQMEVITDVGKGHIDGILTDILMQDYLYEHKALSHFTFVRYWSGEWPLDYTTQICLYNKALRKLNPQITTSVMLIKNKNTAQYIDYKIFYDSEKDTACILEITHSNGQRKIGDPYLFTIENIISDAVKKFQAVDEHIRNKTLPDRQYEMDHWRCAYCQWSETCWADYEKEYANLKEDAKLEGEVVDLCRLYLQLVNTEKDAKEHKEELRNKIVTLLKEQGISKGKTGEGKPGDYTVNYQVGTQKRIKKTEEIPQEILPLITHEIPMERLTVRLIKAKGESK